MRASQQPLHSIFGAASTAAEVMAGIDLTGKLAIVTGGYSGIGLVTARRLAAAGAQVIVPARDPERARTALSDMSHIKVAAMDLGIARSIDAFCQRIVDEGKPISILINRAGIMATPLQRDADGHEAQFAINDLGHYRLTCGLWPALRGGGKARVVAVSSRAHQLAGIDFDDIDFTSRPYDKWLAYGQSKTANVLFAVELDRRGRDHGVRAFSLHPGQILTNLARHLSTEEMASFDAVDEHGRPRLDPDKGLKHVEQGAATSLWCATNPSLAGLGGVYCEDCDIASIHSDQTGRKGVSPWAIDEGNASRLWSVSERLTGLTAG